MKLAVFQMSAAIDPDARLTRIIDAMREAMAEGADLVVAPELALTGYGRGAVLAELAQDVDGPWGQALSQAAAEIGISVVAGYPERDGDDCYISALIIDHTKPDTRHSYRKACRYGPYEKGIFAAPGPSTLLVEMHGLTLGFLICYDIEFPENARRLALAGADVIVVPTALPVSDASLFVAEHGVRVRAFENGVFVAYSDNADADERFAFQGRSSISAPDGSVLAMAPAAGDALIMADIDPAAYQKTRDEIPYLSDLSVITGQ